MQKKILESVQKISFNTMQYYHQVDKNFTIVKVLIANQSRPSFSSINSENTIRPGS